ncbi:Uncharacterised protein [Yersinia pekkanenii]|uniref:Uncharacterized protein n=2 Tax=Yersinia pekkanenii TaxID=1288385 RepID=A0A0T9NKY7_9GAMM|nr:Uncharacterised protein [Yersinia pekkanenii]CRY65701.1 Uncharacterised protein [Yersinia pekkanenii]
MADIAPQPMAVLQARRYPWCPVPLAMRSVPEPESCSMLSLNQWLYCKPGVTHDVRCWQGGVMRPLPDLRVTMISV